MTDHRKDKVGKIKVSSLETPWYELSASPLFWKGKAEELKHSALVLAEAFFYQCDMQRKYFADMKERGSSDVVLTYGSTLDQFVLLAGFALENIFKAYVIFREPGLVTPKRIEKILRSHDLLALADRAGVTLSLEENRFCVLASSAIVSWGRYPISDTSDRSISYVSVSGLAVEVFNVLFERLNAEFADRFKLAHGG